MANPTKFSEITKDMVKKYFGIPTTDTTKDTRIDAVMPIAEDRIKSYCKNPFTALTVTDELPKIMPNSDTFFVAERPITTLTSVKVDGVALVEGTDFVCYKNEGRFVRCQHINDAFTRPYGGLWKSILGATKVTYIGGEPLTMDVVQVYYEIVGIFAGMRTRSYINNAGVEAVASLNNIPKEFLEILDLHSRARTL